MGVCARLCVHACACGCVRVCVRARRRVQRMFLCACARAYSAVMEGCAWCTAYSTMPVHVCVSSGSEILSTAPCGECFCVCRNVNRREGTGGEGRRKHVQEKESAACARKRERETDSDTRTGRDRAGTLTERQGIDKRLSDSRWRGRPFDSCYGHVKNNEKEQRITVTDDDLQRCILTGGIAPATILGEEGKGKNTSPQQSESRKG